MAINNRDDYDKLARVLYPSIEASGNVYYGQTRKLTMDEILGKNNLNFESHIESIQVEDNEKDFGYDYKSYFVWKLGPLHGSVRFNPVKNSDGYTFANFPDHIQFAIINEYEDETNFYYQLHITQDPENPGEIPGYFYDPLPEFWFDHYFIYGTIFAKYEIKFNDEVSFNEVTSSGEYTTYSESAYVEFKDLCVTNRSNPTNALDKNIGNRHFYIDVKDGHYYLYIQICTSCWNETHTNKGNAYYFDADESYEVKWDERFRDPLTITAVEDSISVSLQKNGNVSASAWYSYKLNGGDWAAYDINNPQSILLNVGESVKFKGDIYKYNNAQTDYVRFLISGNGKAKASGDIRSMCADHVKNENTSYSAYQSLFYQCTKLLTAPKLPSTKLNSYFYYRTFALCTNLISSPRIMASQFYSNCCKRMFDSCSMLSKVYPINAFSLGNSTDYKFESLFDGCANINSVEFYLYDKGNINTDYSDDFTSWLSNGYASGILTTNMKSYNIGNIPVGWEVKSIDFVPNDLITYSASANDIIEQGVIRYKQDKLFTSGTNSEDNGRGDLTSKDTLFSMLETNPLYSGGVAFDTYNKDGSFNQEIWGYKSFNSPVMFRNGIYGECASLTTADVTGASELIVYSNGEGIDIRDISTSFGSDFKAAPKDTSKFSPFNPRAYLEVLHVNSEAENIADYRMSESQTGIYSHNKYNSSDNVKFINREALNLDPASITGDYSAFITNASINTDVDPNVVPSAVRITEYTAIASAGSAYIKLSGGSDRDGNEKALIHINATEVSPTVNMQCNLGNIDYRYNNIYTYSITATEVQTQQLHGRVPSISRANYGSPKQMIDLSTCVGSLLFIALRPCRNDLNNAFFPHGSYVYPGDSFSFRLNWIDYISDSQSVPSITDANFADTRLNTLVKDMSFCKISNGSNSSMSGYIHFYDSITDTFPRFVTSNSAVTIQIISFANTLFAEDNECRALYVLAVVR